MTAMPRTENQIPQSALYTSATWQWGRMPCAELVTPADARKLFDYYNVVMFFYRLVNPRWHSLKHTLLHRHGAINYLLKHSECRQVIEIAAGFSPRGCSQSEDAGMRYFEVDMPEVIALKRQQLAGTEAGRSVLARSNFVLMNGDIRSPDLFEMFPKQPSFVITEGLMMYFYREEQMQIWKNIAEFIGRHGGQYVFDYLPIPDEPRRSALGRMLNRLQGKKPQTFKYDNRTREEVAQDLHAAGFKNVCAYDCREIAAIWDLPYPTANTRVIIYHCF